ncbi:hypothetical protein BSY19_5069 (plasmid) [Bosea sp. RAC05]|nr:hypothetical protein BSY19_5069 [Bosea sp. RAC05]
MPQMNSGDAPGGRDASFWMGETPFEDPIPLVSIDRETSRATPYEDDPGGIALHAQEAAQNYLAAAERLIPGSKKGLHIVFDPGLVADGNRSAKYLIVAGEEPSLAQNIADISQRKIGRYDLIVVIGPAVAGWDGDEAEFEEQVSSDLAHLVATLFPVKSEGPIAVMMPWLVRMSASIALTKGASESYLEKSATRCFAGLASAYDGTWNATGQAITKFPAWFPLSDAIARETVVRRARSNNPAVLEDVANIVHDAIASSLVSLGIPVDTRRNAMESRFPAMN